MKNSKFYKWGDSSTTNMLPGNLKGLPDESFFSKDKNGETLVSLEHKVYSSSRNSLSSLIVNTSTTDCSLKCGSSDQTGQFSLNANAKYGESFGSDINLFAQFNCCGETLTFKLTNPDNISFILSNLSSEIFNLEQSNSEYLLSSSRMKGCEYNFSECFLANCLVKEPFFNSENAILVSTTNFIYDFSNLFQIFSLTSSPNFRQSASVNSLSFVNSSSSSNNAILSFWIRTSCLASSDQFTQDSCFISSFIFSGTENVTDGIYNSPLAFSLFNCSTLRMIILLNISDHLISGCLSNFSFNSFVSDNVTVAIFDLPLDCTAQCNRKGHTLLGHENLLRGKNLQAGTPEYLGYVDTQEYVDTYKSFGNPEYYFVSTLKSDDSVRIDSRDYGKLLRVTKAGGYTTGGCPNYVWTGIK